MLRVCCYNCIYRTNMFMSKIGLFALQQILSHAGIELDDSVISADFVVPYDLQINAQHHLLAWNYKSLWSNASSNIKSHYMLDEEEE